jgi:DNA-binding transcriptional ArsR family regulator
MDMARRASIDDPPDPPPAGVHRLKLVQIIDDPRVARLLADPMRRAILNILRRGQLTQAELADNLGLTNATVSHHLSLLKRIGFLSVAKEEVESHGIVKKFYTPSAYLYVLDVDRLPREVARYYYPINIERARGILSALSSASAAHLAGGDVDALGEVFTRTLVKVARKYTGVTTEEAEGEKLVQKLYRETLDRLENPIKKDSK